MLGLHQNRCGWPHLSLPLGVAIHWMANALGVATHWMANGPRRSCQPSTCLQAIAKWSFGLFLVEWCWILLVKPSKTQTPKKQSSNIQQYPAISGNIRQYPALNRRCKELGAPSLVAAKLRTAPSQPSPAPRWPLRLEIPISWP